MIISLDEEKVHISEGGEGFRYTYLRNRTCLSSPQNCYNTGTILNNLQEPIRYLSPMGSVPSSKCSLPSLSLCPDLLLLPPFTVDDLPPLQQSLYSDIEVALNKYVKLLNMFIRLFPLFYRELLKV